MKSETCACFFLFATLAMGCNPESDRPTAVTNNTLVTGFVEINGGRLYYEDQGDGVPLILIHSSNTNVHMWDDQFDVFAENYRVIRYDGRGFGQSQSEMVDFTDYDDLLALYEQLGIDRAILVGLSLGAMTASEFALEHPDRVAALVMAGSGLIGYEYVFSEERLAMFAEKREAAHQGDFNRVAELSVQGYFDAPQRPWTEVDTVLQERLKSMIIQAGTRIRLNQNNLHHFLEPDAIHRVGEINVPLLVILGEYESENEYGIGDILESKILDSKREIIPGSKHLTSMENPEAFNRAVLDFLSGLQGDR